MNPKKIREMLKRILPQWSKDIIRKFREDYWKLRYYMVPIRPYQKGTYPFGINLAGYVRAEMGLGQSCRCMAQGMKAAKIPFSVIDYQHGPNARMGDSTWESEMHGVQYGINVTVINADQMIHAKSRLGKTYWDKRYQIAHYAWELPEYPQEWAKISEMFDEIWTPSTFCTQAIAAAVNRPVYTMPYVITPKIQIERSRAYFGLPENKFLFLCMFDVSSVMERKNPKGTVEAFLKAFDADDEHVGLVIKVNDPRKDPWVSAYLEELKQKNKNICFINEVLTRSDVNALIKCCDCFVSLHRSEGFGLVMAEAMYFEKPVIATNWSANTDFMNADNSCPVAYELTTIKQDYAVYKAGQIWAEPSVDACVYYMKKLVNDPIYYWRIAKAGRETIRKQYGAQRAAKAIRERMKAIDEAGVARCGTIEE